MPPAGTRLLPLTSTPQPQALGSWLTWHQGNWRHTGILVRQIFIPVALESSGAFGNHAIDFFHQLAARMRSISHDPLEYLKLCQRIHVCIQNFNCASILGCCSLVY